MATIYLHMECQFAGIGINHAFRASRQCNGGLGQDSQALCGQQTDMQGLPEEARIQNISNTQWPKQNGDWPHVLFC